MEKIREATEQDASALVHIYNHYIQHSIATFETTPLTEEQMRERIVAISARYPYFVYETDTGVVGYCYLNTWKNKEAYRNTLETTFYIHPGHTGKGIGKKLMRKLLGSLQGTPVHALIACISFPNEGSIRLHESFGFKKVAHYREVGEKFGIRLDVGEWEFLNE